MTVIGVVSLVFSSGAVVNEVNELTSLFEKHVLQEPQQRRSKHGPIDVTSVKILAESYNDNQV